MADDDGFSDPSIYDVMEYARPQQEPEPAYYPFLQETNDWINFDFLVCMVYCKHCLQVYTDVDTGRTLERCPHVVGVGAVLRGVVA